MARGKCTREDGPRRDEDRRASRRHALAMAEQQGAGAPLKMRIEQRRAAMQASSGVMPNPCTPEFGEAPATPRSRSPTPVTPEERRRKSRRITFSALNDALEDVCTETQSAEVASNIQAAQELVKAMFAKPVPESQHLRGAKRSLARSSIDSSREAMTERAKQLWEKANSDSEEEATRDRAMLATPGRFRHRRKGAFQDPWASLAPRKSSPSRSKLPPPPKRPPP
ncbi:unnamed protein product [Effrenium voratum]|uniref:Uncharacterized protein n=1 Tax=Effrenium voratum TaxID=2562239 RepID=A0AA36N9B2_9DINO|nr:unnamed protein product [Effrenium voratum]